VEAHAGHAADDHSSQGTGAPGSARRRSGELSGLVLNVLRQAGRPLTAGDVLERLPDAGAGELAYTTVVTILYRLHAHGLADRSRAGRAYAYQAVADDAQLAARRMQRVLDGEDDRAAVLARFVGSLSAHDEQILRDLLGPDLSPGLPPGSASESGPGTQGG
jgi:predicted transcriptional regulator